MVLRSWPTGFGTVDTGTAQQVLDDVLIQPTFTARPTEARRKTVKAKPRSIAADLETLGEQLLTDKERRQIKLTEQGETIATRYANPFIVERELEQMLNAQVRAQVRATEYLTEPVDEKWTEAIATAADAAREGYQALLGTEGSSSILSRRLLSPLSRISTSVPDRPRARESEPSRISGRSRRCFHNGSGVSFLAGTRSQPGWRHT